MGKFQVRKVPYVLIMFLYDVNGPIYVSYGNIIVNI